MKVSSLINSAIGTVGFLSLLKKTKQVDLEKSKYDGLLETLDKAKQDIEAKATETEAEVVVEGKPQPKPPSSSRLSTEDVVAYQNREIGQELWLLERHFAQGCKIDGTPCDCCEKHTGLEALAKETIPMVNDPSPYQDIIDWCQEVAPKVTEEASASGKYDTEYPKLAQQARELRKELLKTESVGALLSPEEKSKVREAIDKELEAQ